MVEEAQANMGILLAEQLQLFQKDQTQGIFAGTDGNQTMLQLTVLADLLLTDGKLLKSQGNVFIKLAAFRCKCDSLVGAEKESTFQLLLQVVHTAGDIWLVVVKSSCCLGKALILGYIIENSIVVVSDHVCSPSYNMILICLRY